MTRILRKTVQLLLLAFLLFVKGEVISLRDYAFLNISRTGNSTCVILFKYINIVNDYLEGRSTLARLCTRISDGFTFAREVNEAE